jgi:hypothetical protein
MPFVARNDKGEIVALHAQRAEGAEEEIGLDDPAVRRFLAGDGPGGTHRAELRDDLAASDLELVRVIEDLVYLLIDKRVIVLTDLPKAARDKLSRRRGLRDKLNDLGGIVGAGDDVMLP